MESDRRRIGIVSEMKKEEVEKMTELPVAFRERMKKMLGEEAEAFFESYETERTQGLRLNLLKTNRERFLLEAPFSLTPIPWAPEGFYYEAGERPGRHPWHEAGVYYIQEPSAMSVVTFLDPQAGDRVLDLCAAPGGKTTQIASRLQGEGFLLSNEIHPARAKILSQNVERMGIRNAVVTNEDSGRLAARFPEFFDKIVVDAPCSGEGMFRKEEQAVSEWSPENVRHCAKRQQEILANAALMLKAGGRLVYSTCTFAPEENEQTILSFLRAHPDFELEKAPEYEGLSRGVPEWGILSLPEEQTEDTKENERMNLRNGTVRIWPHRTEGEGHFIAVLRKNGSAEKRKRKLPAYYAEKKALSEYALFCQETLTKPEDWIRRTEFVLFGDQLSLLPPEMPDFSGLRVLRAGLHLGTLKKNRFEPSHALALALKPEEVRLCREITAASGEAAAYLRGEMLEAGALCVLDGQAEKKPAKGWTLVAVDGYSLGWAKLSGGQLKNHYPKGLRKG